MASLSFQKRAPVEKAASCLSRFSFHLITWINCLPYYSKVMTDAPDSLSSLHLDQLDPIEAVSAAVIAHMNDDHSDANLDYARGPGGCPEAISAKLLKINRLGIVLQVTTSDDVKTIPIQFPEPLESQDQIRPALINLLTDARKSLEPANQSPHQETSE